MMDTLVTIAAINPVGAPETLRFSVRGHIDGDGNLYAPFLKKSVLAAVVPNDGGLLAIFSPASVGDMELENRSGDLDYLADYGLDGGEVIVSRWDGAAHTERFRGVAGAAYNTGAAIILPVKARQEALKDNHPLGTYAGDNTPPGGLEGAEDTIKGRVKPRVYGDCRNITPVNVNDSLQIYQASDGAGRIITAVYMDGVRLSNYRTAAAHGVGATDIAVSFGLGPIPTGARALFDGHPTLYTVTAGLTAGVITISPGLTQAVPLRAAVEVVDFYPDTAALQAHGHRVDGDHAEGGTVIAVTGAGAVAVGALVTFSGHLTVYTVSVALSGGAFTISAGLTDDVADGEFVSLADAHPVLWGGHGGYFRLAVQAIGTVTCDCISVDAHGAAHRAGDVLGAIAHEAGLSAAPAAIAALNAVGVIGVAATDQISTEALLGRVMRGVLGYYWHEGGEIHANLLAAPGSGSSWAIHDWQIIDVETHASGLGEGGVPAYQLTVKHDPIETVQDTVAGAVPPRFRQRLKSAHRELRLQDAAVLARHRSSLPATIETAIRRRADAAAAGARFFGLIKADRVALRVTVDIGQAGGLQIGAAGTLITSRFGYESGKSLVLLAYEMDDDHHSATLLLVG